MDERRKAELEDALIEKGKEIIALFGEDLGDDVQVRVCVWNDHISVSASKAVKENDVIDFTRLISCWADPTEDPMTVFRL